MYLLLLLVSVLSARGDTTIRYAGCHKIASRKICQLASKEEASQQMKNISTSVAKAVEWLRKQHIQNLWFDVPTSSWILQSLHLAGFAHENKHCMKTIQSAMTQIDAAPIDDFISLSGGKLALLMIGMRASCKDVKNFKQRNLINILRKKMYAFPKGEFDNFYQYCLGVIALYVNGQDIPSEFGEEILSNVLIGRKDQGTRKILNPNKMAETEALSVIALSAIGKQKFMSHWVRKHIYREQEKAVKKINHIFRRHKPDSLMTHAHMMQAMRTINGDKITQHPFCEKIYNWIISQQNQDGSFGGVMETANVLLALSERSVLELRHVSCPEK
ncbi:uncharacterized protein LOC130623023 isoform X2 [Hydractinia symbiolongicarpus]|nr:uncharacterized protein LOC130623023 isoform X2 [Hydractinia symbiolongicarpus]